jgi:hypothetical protein
VPVPIFSDHGFDDSEAIYHFLESRNRIKTKLRNGTVWAVFDAFCVEGIVGNLVQWIQDNKRMMTYYLERST